MEKKCPPGKILNKKTGRCNIKKCPPGKILNKETGRCNIKKTKKKLKIVEAKNSTDKVCPSGKILNKKTNRCINKSKKKCPSGKILNKKTGRCIIQRISLQSNSRKKNTVKNWKGNMVDILNGYLKIVEDEGNDSTGKKIKNNVCNSLSFIFEDKSHMIESMPDFEDVFMIFDFATSNPPEMSFPYLLRENKLFEIIKNCKKKKKNLFAIPLIIWWKTGEGHFNIIIFDLKKKTIEFFEPYGAVPSTDVDTLLQIKEFEMKFVKISQKYLGSDFKYLSALDFCPVQSFQTRNEGYGSKRKSDPEGFCGAWGLWYLHMRLLYPDVNPENLVTMALKNMTKNNKGYRRFIRNYTQFLLD